jgi:hypothetical protein
VLLSDGATLTLSTSNSLPSYCSCPLFQTMMSPDSRPKHAAGSGMV